MPDRDARVILWPAAQRSHLAIPADVPPGSYRVQVTADEETAFADLTVTPATNAAEVDDHAEDRPEPTAAPMELDRPKSVAITMSVLAAGLLSLVLGLWLVRR